jgi:hypothetical protein
MTKLNQIKVGMLAMAIVLMSVVLSVAQTANPGPATGAQSSKPKYPAAAELKNFKADPANSELSEMNLSLLKMKAELEAGVANNSLSEEYVKGLTRRIELLQGKVNEMTAQKASVSQETERENQRKAVSRDALIVQLKSTNRISREQFLTLELADQKAALQNNVTITDLVNSTSETLRSRADGNFYIAASAFSSFDIEKQIHILKNPSNYIITTEELAAPQTQKVSSDPEIKTHTISRAQLNSFSPERRKAIENSKDFTITD